MSQMHQQFAGGDMKQQLLPPLQKELPPRPPRALELYVMDIVANWRPPNEKRAKEQPYILVSEIVEALMPHSVGGIHTDGPPIDNCEKWGWLGRPMAMKQISSKARILTQEGRDIMQMTAPAIIKLDEDIAEEEARQKLFRKKVEHTNLPRLRELRKWLAGEEAPQESTPESPVKPANEQPQTSRGPAAASTAPLPPKNRGGRPRKQGSAN